MENEQLPHHIRQPVCRTRAPYRDSKKEKAVKTYTVLEESRYVLALKVPQLNVTNDLVRLFALYGDIQEYRVLENYPCELFQIAVWIKYQSIDAARIAKSKIDDHIFFGNQLHVCYAPEYETKEELKSKLDNRKSEVLNRIQINARERRNIAKRNEQSEAMRREQALKREANSSDDAEDGVGEDIDAIAPQDTCPPISPQEPLHTTYADQSVVETQSSQFGVPYPSMIPDIHHPAVAQAMAASNMSMNTRKRIADVNPAPTTTHPTLPPPQSGTSHTGPPSTTDSDFTRIQFSATKPRPHLSAKPTERLDVLAANDRLLVIGRGQFKMAAAETEVSACPSTTFVPRQLREANQRLRRQALVLGKKQGPQKKHLHSNYKIDVEDTEIRPTIDIIRNKMFKVPNLIKPND